MKINEKKLDQGMTELMSVLKSIQNSGHKVVNLTDNSFNVIPKGMFLMPVFSFFNKKIQFTIFCTGAALYQYEGYNLQKATNFSHFPDSPGRELQPPLLLY